MTAPISIIADKDLAQALQQPICNLPGAPANSEDIFCSSNPQSWPAAGNNQTQFIYPSTDRQDSVPGTEYFCTDYLNWLKRLASMGDHTHSPTYSFLREIDPSGQNTDRFVEGLTRFSDFCHRVEDIANSNAQEIALQDGNASQPPQFSSPPPSTPPPGDFISNYGMMLAETVAAAAVVLGSLAIVIKKLQTNLVSFIKALVTWENLAQVLKFQKPDITVKAHVVSHQLEGLASERNFTEQGKRFAALEEQVKIYAVDLAINEWNRLWRTTQSTYLFLEDTDGRAPNELPWGFIRYFAKRYLQAGRLDALRVSAASSIAEKITNPPPDLSRISAQIVAQKGSMGNESVAVLNELANLARLDWFALPDEKKADLVDLINPYIQGELPPRFIAGFATDENVEIARRMVSANAQNKSGNGNSSGGSAPAGGSTVAGTFIPTETTSGSGTPQAGSPRSNMDMATLIALGARFFFGEPMVSIMRPTVLGIQTFAIPRPIQFAPIAAVAVPVH